jgi:hypothetical protein
MATVDGIDIERLHDAVLSSYRDLGSYRQKSAEFIRQYAGAEYADNGKTMSETPVNMMELAVGIYSYRLAANAPKGDVRTPYQRLRPYADTLRLALDYLCPHIDIGGTLRRVVKDAMFGMGIVKVGINDTDQLLRGFSVEGGQPFAERVSPVDFVFDTTAKEWKHCQFIGNRFVVDAEALKNVGGYEHVEELTEAGLGNPHDDGEMKASDMTGGGLRFRSYRPRYILWEIWLPFENLMVTMDEDLEKILRVQEWTGPREGPYIILSFNDVPDNILPLPPTAVWSELHVFANEMWRKLFRQSKRQKSITAFAGGSEKDAERVRNSADGEVVHVDNMREIQELRYGGPDQQLLGLVATIDPIFSRIAGNLDIAGGLDNVSPTATQDAIINQNSSVRFDKMAACVSEFAGEILTALAWWMWTDPYIDIPLVKRISPTLEIPVSFDERAKQGEFFDYTFTIVPYSMTNKTPEQQYQMVAQVLQALFLPYIEVAMQQGVMIDMPGLFKLVSRWLDIPELNSVLSIGDPQPPQPGEGPRIQKPQTHSVYERISRPAADYASQMNAVSRAAMGENLPTDVRESIGRSTQ